MPDKLLANEALYALKRAEFGTLKKRTCWLDVPGPFDSDPPLKVNLV